MSNLVRRNNNDFFGNIFDNFLGDFITPIQSRTVNDFTILDSKEFDDKIIYAFPIPGVSKEDIDVKLIDNRIEIGWTKKILDIEEEGRKIFTIGTHMNKDTIEAELKDGILYMTVFKPEQKKPKMISLK